MRFLIAEFSLNGHLQALGAALAAGVFALMLGLPLDAGMLAAVYAVFYAVWLYNRLREGEKDREGNPQRTEHVTAHRRILEGQLAGAVLVALLLFLLDSSETGLLAGAVFLGYGVLYTDRLKGLTAVIPGFKNAAVALLFAPLPFVPALWHGVGMGQLQTEQALLLSVFLAVKAATAEVFLDIKDAWADHQQGLQTLPVLFGTQPTLASLAVFTLAFTPVVPVVFAFFIPVFGPSLLPVLLIILWDLATYALAFRGVATSRLLAEGEVAVLAFLLLAGHVFL